MGVQDLVREYDTAMQNPLSQEYYGFSGFFNYGYWEPGTRDQREASENLVDALLASAASKQGTILDVACGLGATTKHLLKYYPAQAVVGVTLSPAQLEASRRSVPGVRFAAMDAAALALRDGVFETVICVEAAFHFVTRETFVREAYRVLKPGGTLVLSDIIFGRVPRRHDRQRWVPENFVDNLAQYRDVFLRSGFASVDVVDATARCWKPFRRNIVRWGFRKLRARQMPVVNYARSLLFWTAADLVTRHYVLVAANKP